MDPVALLLSVTLTVTTVFLIIVGVQLIFVLRDLRTSLKKVNTIVEGFEKVGVGIEHGFTELSGFVGGLKSLFKVIDMVSKKDGNKHHHHEKN